MFETASFYLRRIAGVMKGDLHIEEIKIFFSAPKPSSPSSKGLTIDKEKSNEANFQWITYQILFSKGEEKKEPKYYIYSVNLEPEGKERLPDKVFESDSAWSATKKDIPTKDLTPGEVKTTFPKILKHEGGPNLHPEEFAKTVYINYDDSEKGAEYSSDEFKKAFDNNFYVVLNPHSRERKNPFDKLTGTFGIPKKEPTR
jgi:hypothetical protein